MAGLGICMKPAILIVEDDPVLLNILCKIVENGGYQPLPAANAVTALDTLKESTPCLILEDISLPDLNGVDLVACIRRIPGYEAIPVIFLSASAERIAAARFMGDSLSEYLTKPLKPAQLLTVISSMLQPANQ